MFLATSSTESNRCDETNSDDNRSENGLEKWLWKVVQINLLISLLNDSLDMKLIEDDRFVAKKEPGKLLFSEQFKP